MANDPLYFMETTDTDWSAVFAEEVESLLTTVLQGDFDRGVRKHKELHHAFHKIENRPQHEDPDLCGHSIGGVRCTRPVGHDGPHANPPAIEVKDSVGLLTEAEWTALDKTSELVKAVRAVLQPEKNSQNAFDYTEFVTKIHDIQHMVMSNAAARAYPDRFRLIGGR